MPWKGVTVSEQRQRFLEDFRLNYYSITDLAERFGISRRTAHKWVNRFEKHGQEGFDERSRRPHSCPWQTDPAIVEELVSLGKAHTNWGPAKLLDLMHQGHPQANLRVVSTAARILARQGWFAPGAAVQHAVAGCRQSACSTVSAANRSLHATCSAVKSSGHFRTI